MAGEILDKSQLQILIWILKKIHPSGRNYFRNICKSRATYIEEPQELIDLVNTIQVVQKYLLKQTYIDEILDIIKRKVLKGTHLPLTMKEIQAGYLTSPIFKDIYQFLAQKKLPSKRSAIHKVEILSERFVLLDSLLFKLITVMDKEKALLTIHEVCADKIRTLYHASLFAGHQGVIKTYLTM